METNMVVFRGRQIRKTIYNNEWWFSIVDIVEVLTGSERPRKYWNDLKKKLSDEGYDELSEKIGQLKMQATEVMVLDTADLPVDWLYAYMRSAQMNRI